MKKAFITLAIIGLITATATAQTIVRDKDGNFKQVKTEQVQQDSTTQHTYTDNKGKIYKVYKGTKGGYYIARVSKNGKFYRQYLKTEEEN